MQIKHDNPSKDARDSSISGAVIWGEAVIICVPLVVEERLGHLVNGGVILPVDDPDVYHADKVHCTV